MPWHLFWFKTHWNHVTIVQNLKYTSSELAVKNTPNLFTEQLGLTKSVSHETMQFRESTMKQIIIEICDLKVM